MTSPKTLKFYLPLPAKELFPNARFATRGGMYVKARAVKAARAAAKAEALRVLDGARPPRWVKARYQATCYKLSARFWDPDNFNASLKPYMDGLADAGIVANDRGLWPERPEFVKTDRMPRVEVVITEEDKE